jgi:hypothetical protein
MFLEAGDDGRPGRAARTDLPAKADVCRRVLSTHYLDCDKTEKK